MSLAKSYALAKSHPALYFGNPKALSYHAPARHMATRGPFIFRLRLVSGERVVGVGGEHAGRFGTVVGLHGVADSAALAERCAAPYSVHLDGDEEDAAVAMTADCVRRVSADGSQRRVQKAAEEEVAPGTPRGGRRAWSVEELGEPPAAPAPAPLSGEDEGAHEMTAVQTGGEDVATADITDPPTAAPDAAAPATEAEAEAADVSDAPAAAHEATSEVDAKCEAAPAAVPEPNGAYIYECIMPVDALMAGRVFDLPIRGVSGLVPIDKGQRVIRFAVPDQIGLDSSAAADYKPWLADPEKPQAVRSGGGAAQPWVLVQALLKFKPAVRVRTEVALPRLMPSPWIIASKHWKVDAMSSQSADGTLRLAKQTPVGEFTSVMSTHVMDGTDCHQFSFVIARATNDHATGMKVGVCSADGTRAWLLRLSDARLCDADGDLLCPISDPPLIESAHLPPRYTGCRVEFRCNMAKRTLGT